MFNPPLFTKLTRPAVGHQFIERPHLLSRLDQGLATRVTLISAPAGYGKSVLVSSWLDRLDMLSASSSDHHHKSSWLSIDEEDDNFVRFVSYLVSAIQQRLPDSCVEVNQLIQQGPPPSIETVADLLLNSLGQQADPLVLVLDDLHNIKSSAIFEFLARLVKYAPRTFHMVLISRVDPPLPLNRWRAQGLLNELRLNDLSFSLADAGILLGRNLPTVPEASLVETLHRRTEGWAVGLQLASLALKRHTDSATFLSDFDANDSRYIVDYLVDEVLDQQPRHLNEFLVSTAILNRFSAGLCAALLDMSEAEAQRHISTLERENLFLIALGRSPRWYRYHNQFQDMLISRLFTRYDRKSIATLRRRAADWLAAHGQVDEALQHLVAIPDMDAAVALIESHRIAALNHLRFVDLAAWLERIPSHVVNQRLELTLSEAWIHFEQIEHEQCLAVVRCAATLLREQAADLPEASRNLYEIELAALRTTLDSSLSQKEALDIIVETWSKARTRIAGMHGPAVLWLAYTSHRSGDIDLALEIVTKALDRSVEWPIVCRARISHEEGILRYCLGDLAGAERRFRQNLLLAEEHGLDLIGTHSHHGLGAIADTRNQLADAERHHLAVVQQPYVANGRNAVRDMYSLISIYVRCGEQKKIRPLIEHMKTDADMMGNAYFSEQVAALDAYAELACGRLSTALLWALGNAHQETVAPSDRFPMIDRSLQIRARIFLAEGSEASLLEAERILQELLQKYAADYIWYHRVEVLVLQALVRDRLGNPDGALTVLAEAVQLAVPKGGVGLFMGFGEAIEDMLCALETDPAISQPVALLLAAHAADDVSWNKKPIPQDLPEKLTERELSVLQLIAARYSNKEIASRLVISPHTVRNHTANIYSKLQVTNRREAAKRAQTLGLLVGDGFNQPLDSVLE